LRSSEACDAEVTDVSHPRLVSIVELPQRGFGSAYELDAWRVRDPMLEVGSGWPAQDLDQVCEPPRDRRDWLVIGMRVGVVHHELASADRR
jgi:hypothetical protein